MNIIRIHSAEVVKPVLFFFLSYFFYDVVVD